MKDVMIDIETLGTRSDAMIIQIGACYFDRLTGEIGRTFSMNIDPESFGKDFSTDYDTIKWWFSRSLNAQDLVMKDSVKLGEVVSKLSEFLWASDIYIWSHATFDIPILEHAFEVVGRKFPVHYRRMRDIRTLMDIANHHSVQEREGVHHNALDDCKFQVAYCVEAFQKLYGNN